MRIAFLGDNSSQNAKGWLTGLRSNGVEEIVEWESKGFASDLIALFKIGSWLNKVRPDLIIGYRTTSYGFLAALLAKKPLVVAVQGETDLWPYHPISLPFKRFTKSYCVKKASLIHAWGENMVPSLIEHGASFEKIMVMPRGVDLNIFGYSEDKHGINLISTRGLYPEYNHTIELEVLKEVIDKGYDCTLTLLGDGPERQSLTEKASMLEITEFINFKGRISHDNIPGLLAKCSFYVSFPETEGTSASLLEAMACGCYPLVSDLPANESWINSNDNGLLSNDPKVMADHLITVYEDQIRFLSVIRKNRKIVEKRADFNKNMAAFVQKYKELISQ